MHKSIIVLLLVVCGQECEGHTITFGGIATEVGNGGGFNYFGITSPWQTFTAEIDFTDTKWLGNSTLDVLVEYAGTPTADIFDGGAGIVSYAIVGQAVNYYAGFIQAQFDASGTLVFLQGGDSYSLWIWNPAQGVNFFGESTHMGVPVSMGIITNIAFDGSVVLAPEPATWLLSLPLLSLWLVFVRSDSAPSTGRC
jgi:hypothetical protein